MAKSPEKNDEAKLGEFRYSTKQDFDQVHARLKIMPAIKQQNLYILRPEDLEARAKSFNYEFRSAQIMANRRESINLSASAQSSVILGAL